MSSITSGNAEQYSDSRKLAARARLNSEYTIAEIGWFPWVAKQFPLNAGDSVLDVGCENGGTKVDHGSGGIVLLRAA